MIRGFDHLSDELQPSVARVVGYGFAVVGPGIERDLAGSLGGHELRADPLAGQGCSEHAHRRCDHTTVPR